MIYDRLNPKLLHGLSYSASVKVTDPLGRITGFLYPQGSDAVFRLPQTNEGESYRRCFILCRSARVRGYWSRFCKQLDSVGLSVKMSLMPRSLFLSQKSVC